VTPGVRMDCGVMPNGQRISLKGAVAHFFLLSFLFPFPFLTQQLVCTHPRIEASDYNPSPLVLVLPRPPPHAALVCVLPRPPPRAAFVCVLSSAAAACRLFVGGGFRPLRALRTLRPAGCLEFG